MRIKVLLIEDNHEHAVMIHEMLALARDAPFDVESAESLSVGLERLNAGDFDVVLLDLWLPDSHGLDTFARAHAHAPDVPIVVLSVRDDEDLAVQAVQGGAQDYLVKEGVYPGLLDRAIRYAIERKRTEKALRSYAGQLEALREVGLELTAQLDLDALLHSIVSRAVELLEGTAGGLELYQPEQDVMECVSASGDDSPPIGAVVRPGEGLSGKVLETGKPLIINDYSDWELPASCHGQHALASVVGVPIRWADEFLGVLTVGVPADSPRTFRAADAELLGLFANQAAIAIRNARALKAEEQQRRRAETLARASAALTSTLELEALLKNVLAAAMGAIPAAQKGSVLLLDEASGELHIRALVGYGDPRVRAMRFPHDRGYAVQAANNGRPLLICDARAEAVRYDGEIDEIRAIQSAVVAPLRYRGRITGALSLDNISRKDAFTEEDMHLLAAFADQAAVAVANARLFEETRQAALEQETLRETALALTTALERSEVIERILAQLQEVVPYDSALVQLLKDDQLVIAGGRGFSNLSDVLGRSFAVSSDDPNGEVIRTRAPAILADAPAAHAIFSDKPPGETGAHSWLGVPMLVGERVLGMIALAKHVAGFYTREHARLAEAFAAQAAIAVENSRLFQAEREQRELAEALAAAAAAVSSTLDLDKVLDRILEQVERVVAGDAFNIMLAEDGNARMVRWRGYGQADIAEPTSSVVVPVARYPPLRRMEQEGRPVLVLDTVSDPHWNPLESRGQWRSYVAAPIRMGVLTLGFLNVNSFRPGQFGPTDARRLEAFANQAAIAIENARLYARQQRRAEEAGLLLEIANAVSSTLELNDALKEVTLRAARACDAHRCTILLLDEGGEALVPFMSQFASGRNDPDLWQLFRDASYPERVENVAEALQVIRDRRPLFVPDARASGLPRRWIEPFGVGSLLVVPLISRERVVGLLGLDRPETDFPFTPEQVSLAMTVANQAAVSIEKARLYAETARSLAQTRVLREVMLAADSTLDFDQVLERTCETLRSTMQVDFLSVVLPDEEGEALIPHPSRIGYSRPAEQLRLPLHESVCGRVFQTGEALIIGDVRTIPYYYEGAEEVRSELCVPVRAGGRVIGVLNVESCRLNAFDEDDLAFYTAIAGQLGVALENAHLYQELRRHAAELRAALTELQDLERLKNEFIQNVSHELRQPLALILGYAEWLDAGELGELAPGQRGPVQIIARRARMLSDLVEDITLLLTAETRTSEREPVAVAELARAAAEDFQRTVDEAGLTLTTDIASGLSPVTGAHLQLRRVLDNLLGNAVKFTPAGGTVSVRLWQEGDHVVLEVGDTGIGIPPEEQERVFQRFYQVDGSSRRRYSGVGLGLALVSEIVEAHGGTIHVESEVRIGSTFTVTLPVRRDSGHQAAV